MANAWVLRVNDFFQPNKQYPDMDPNYTVIIGELVTGNVEDIVISTRGLDKLNLPCELFSDEQVLMEVILGFDGRFGIYTTTLPDDYHFCVRTQIPNRYKAFIEKGLFIRMCDKESLSVPVTFQKNDREVSQTMEELDALLMDRLTKFGILEEL